MSLTPLSPSSLNIARRLRRLRRTPAIRSIVQETRLSPDRLMAPYFVRDGNDTKAFKAMPRHPQRSLPDLMKHLEDFAKKGGKSLILFGIPEHKDSRAGGAWAKDGIIQRSCRQIKKAFGDDLIVAADLCFCEYMDHGHCGILKKGSGVRGQGSDKKNNIYEVDNDATLKLMGKTAVSLAESGADIIAPSGMMDGQVAAIRQSLEKNSFKDTVILSYSAKYASTLYGPFRELAESAPSFGDRKSYQMNPANSDEALREIALDIEEGADIVMVKPALFYLDIIAKAKEAFRHPMAAFQVSGEAWMVEQYASSGMAKREAAVLESVLAVRRAGADIIITYFTEELLSMGSGLHLSLPAGK